MNVGNVANPFAKARASLNTREFTLEKVLMSVLNAENLLIANLISCNTRDFTLETDLRSPVVSLLGSEPLLQGPRTPGTHPPGTGTGENEGVDQVLELEAKDKDATRDQSQA
ncbi:hypothetical protein QTO34_009783 [Cnephaeus nilssonii]|uniref:Uncharacterized protein n=1 Tax=Cnephaeus nilssonii TaxID=3371016 RepID=A0AA40HFA4_CNENI|nr:hypothetical protein QTO34_009783 [Eptesicus nilssonii]